MGDLHGNFTVGSPGHHDKLTAGLWNQYRAKRGVDLYFEWSGRTFATHQVVVDVFLSHEKLCMAFDEDDVQPPPPADLIDSMLEFMYRGTVTVAGDRLDRLQQLARRLDFGLLVESVEAVLADTPPPCTCQHLIVAGGSQKANTGKSPTSSAAQRNVQGRRSKRKPVRLSETAESVSGDDEEWQPPKYQVTAESSDDETSKPAAKRRVLTRPVVTKATRNRKSCRQSEENAEPTNKPEADVKSTTETASLPANALTSLPVLECQHCEFKTTEFSSYAAHTRSAHSKFRSFRVEPLAPEEFTCGLCSFVCTGWSELKSHHTSDHPNRRLFRCQWCNFTSNEGKAQVVRHVNDAHLGLGMYVCEICGDNRFSAEEQLLEHKATHAAPKPPLECPTCGKTFEKRFQLTVHERRHNHPYICDVCGRTFAIKDSLTKHSRIHTGERPFQCHICGKAFTDDSTFRRHRLTHEANAPLHDCQKCGRSFRRIDNLRAHVKRHHPPEGRGAFRGRVPGTTFSCALCVDPPYSGTRTVMERHAKEAHPGQKIFGCAECSFLTAHVPALAVHLRVHTGERPYKCGECGRAFRDPSNYRGHLRYHSRGEKQFQCTTCNHSFHLRGNLKFHLKKVHHMSIAEMDAVLGNEVAPADRPVAAEVNSVLVQDVAVGVHADGVLDLTDAVYMEGWPSSVGGALGGGSR